MKHTSLLLMATILLLSFPVIAQKAPVKFGDISEKDFVKSYAVDSSAAAVIIADIGSSKIEGNNKGTFTLEFKRYCRIHILNKNGFDAANFSIRLFAEGRDGEQLDKLKAVTYNLENGKVVQSKLSTKEAVFKNKLNKNWEEKKFTLPNVKEGSIIECEYTITSDYLNNLQPWAFQGEYPRLWSEYNATLPDFFSYALLDQKQLSYDVEDKKVRRTMFIVTDPKSAVREDAFSIEANVTDFRWVIKNAPALQPEKFISTMNNYVARIEFQMVEQMAPLAPHKFITTWPEFAKTLLGRDDFGQSITMDVDWLSTVVSPIIKDKTTEIEKAKSIYTYIRDNYTCTNRNGILMEQGIRGLVKNRTGNVAELNILLTALLKVAGLNADPVILSTRNNGNTYSKYPLPAQYNYVIAALSAGGRNWYLDASDPRLGFGYIPLNCYNGHARVINAGATAIELKPEAVTETRSSTVFMSNSNGKLVGSVQQMPGYYESQEVRKLLKAKGEAQLLADLQQTAGQDLSLSNLKVDLPEDDEKQVSLKYDIDLKGNGEDILYINPYFNEARKDNPFKSANRAYPIEMPCLVDETYTLQLEVPQGYTAEELPKPVILKMNQKGDFTFDYKVSRSGETISVNSRLRSARASFTPDEYQQLREFFSQVVKKQSEQIVFKKKK